MFLKTWRQYYLTMRRPFWLVVGLWLVLPSAVIFGWPVLLWWMARLLSRSAGPWLTVFLAIIIGLQTDLLTQQPLGVDILLFGATLAWLELWQPSAVDWREPLGDVVWGGIFSSIFFLINHTLVWSRWWPQMIVLIGVNLITGGLTLWWRRK